MIVGLVFYKYLKEITHVSLDDCIIILADYILEDINSLFSDAYNQDFLNIKYETQLVLVNDTPELVKKEPVDKEDIKQELDYEFVDIVKKDDLDDKKGREDEYNYSCSLCEYMTKRSDNLKNHVERMHTLQKDEDNLINFSCDNCSYSSNRIENLIRHKKTDCSEKNAKCLFCDKRSLNKEAARKHRERNHQQEWKQYNLLPIPISEESKQKIENEKANRGEKVKCEMCPQILSKDHLRKHIVHVHKQGSVKKAEHIYPKISCPHCEMKVSSLTIRKHLRLVHSVRGGLGSLEVDCNFCLVKLPISGFEYHVRSTCSARGQ